MKKIIVLFVGAFLLLQSTSMAVLGEPDAIETFQNAGILVGDESGDLRLDEKVTRAEFARLLWETGMVEKNENNQDFSDVSSSHWAYEYINQLAGNQLLCGYPDGTFLPDQFITLVQAERIALRVLLQNPMLNTSDFKCGAMAIDYDLLFGVTSLQEEEITRKDAVHLLYQTMQEQQLQNEPFPTYYGSGAGAVGSPAVVTPTPAPSSSNTPQAPLEPSKVGGGASYGSDGASSPIAPIPPIISEPDQSSNEDYATTDEGGFKKATLSPLSTFSIDTDTASYSNMRRFILAGNKPTKGAVRIEELINYFTYDNQPPQEGTPFGVTTEVGICPWNQEHLLARISVQGEELEPEVRQPQNLVFLIDVSGSMYDRNKLPLVRKSMGLLLEQLDERDRVSLVTYAGGTRVVLEGVPGDQKETIQTAIDSLTAGGGTAGGAGLLLAYEQALANRTQGNNRIILCTDGDFNIGVSSNSEMKALVTEKREQGIFISVLGFGMGNYKDSKLEILADHGNGNYYYIDSLKEAKKVLADEMTKTLYTIAKDVKIQAEFNPATVAEYRLIGYENRMLQTEDFENDKKDAGELGAGSTVTVLYEIIPGEGSVSEQKSGAELRYQTMSTNAYEELFCVKVRYKEPLGTESRLLEFPVGTAVKEQVSSGFSFAAAVAELGMILNESEYLGSASYESVLSLAQKSRGEDSFGYRGEFISLVDLLQMIDRQ